VPNTPLLVRKQGTSSYYPMHASFSFHPSNSISSIHQTSMYIEIKTSGLAHPTIEQGVLIGLDSPFLKQTLFFHNKF
jgi:hypothetical protein